MTWAFNQILSVEGIVTCSINEYLSTEKICGLFHEKKTPLALPGNFSNTCRVIFHNIIGLVYEKQAISSMFKNDCVTLTFHL